jgi:hypothetical protein
MTPYSAAVYQRQTCCLTRFARRLFYCRMLFVRRQFIGAIAMRIVNRIGLIFRRRLNGCVVFVGIIDGGFRSAGSFAHVYILDL